MNRGSQMHVLDIPVPLPAFNEAPIHESGKYLVVQVEARVARLALQ